MKQGFILITLCLLAMIAVAQEDRYTTAMTESIALLEQAQSPEDFVSVANTFERIAAVEQDKWHAPYYAAYATTISAAMQNDPGKIDEILDRAQALLDQSLGVDHDASEVLAVQGFIHMLRIGVDPGTRGPQYSGMSSMSLQKAREANPENPRALYLSAELSYGTAQFFGSDVSASCDMNKKALQLFEASSQGENADPLAPVWGKAQAEAFKIRCL